MQEGTTQARRTGTGRAKTSGWAHTGRAHAGRPHAARARGPPMRRAATPDGNGAGGNERAGTPARTGGTGTHRTRTGQARDGQAREGAGTHRTRTGRHGGRQAGDGRAHAGRAHATWEWARGHTLARTGQTGIRRAGTRGGHGTGGQAPDGHGTGRAHAARGRAGGHTRARAGRVGLTVGLRGGVSVWFSCGWRMSPFGIGGGSLGVQGCHVLSCARQRYRGDGAQRCWEVHVAARDRRFAPRPRVGVVVDRPARVGYAPERFPWTSRSASGRIWDTWPRCAGCRRTRSVRGLSSSGSIPPRCAAA